MTSSEDAWKVRLGGRGRGAWRKEDYLTRLFWKNKRGKGGKEARQGKARTIYTEWVSQSVSSSCICMYVHTYHHTYFDKLNRICKCECKCIVHVDSFTLSYSIQSIQASWYFYWCSQSVCMYVCTYVQKILEHALPSPPFPPSFRSKWEMRDMVCVSENMKEMVI